MKKEKSTEKKPIYKRKWFIALIIVFLFAAIGGCGGTDDSEPDDTNKPAAEEQKEEEQKEEEEKKTPDEIASEMGQNYFTMIDWDSVFKYKSDVHYIMGYSCSKTAKPTYGEYVATAPADLQNGFGAEFESTIYIFMDGNGIIQHVFYEEADGTATEIPMDQIPVEF